jgi:ABC-type transporter Mla subunit MlaD
MSLKSSLAAAKQLTETFAALGEAEKVLTEAVKAESLLASHKKTLADLSAEVNAAASDKARILKECAEAVKHATDEAAAITAKAKAEAQTILDEASHERIAAKEAANTMAAEAKAKVAGADAKVKFLENTITKLTGDAEAAEARLVKAKEAVAKLLG